MYDTLPNRGLSLCSAVVAVCVGLASLASMPAAAAEWDTDWSRKAGITLLETRDSSGPAAWDPAAHPLVYLASEGPGYGGLLSKTAPKTPGFVLVDANTREGIASRHYDLGYEQYFEPHGSGASPDGKWIYVPTGTHVAPWSKTGGYGRLLIIDAKTLKIHKILQTYWGAPHHINAYKDYEGRDRVLVSVSNSHTFVMDPNDDHRVVGALMQAVAWLKYGGQRLGFVEPSGRYIFYSTIGPFSATDGGVAIQDTKTWEIVNWISTQSEDPNFVAFSADGKFAYITNDFPPTFARITMEGEAKDWKLTGMSHSGVSGPYGVSMNWDDTEAWIVDKGEASHNKAVIVGMVKTKLMRPPPWKPWTPGAQGQWYTGCKRGDHGLIHPDPEKNEMWISCNSSFETVVWDMGEKKVKARIPTANGGSTHNGAFIRYNPDFTGELLSDQNGLRGSALEKKRALIAAAATTK